MSSSRRALIEDILQALEANRIYQAGPPGLPCSILFSKTVADRQASSHITFEHVVTDETMLSLLQGLSIAEWLEYASGQIRLELTEQAWVQVSATELHKPMKEREREPVQGRHYGFFPHGGAGG